MRARTHCVWLAVWLCTFGWGCSSDSPAPQSAAASGGATAATTGAGSTSPQANQPPRVKLKTTKGDIVIELDAEKAPLTVDNFLTYVESGEYDGTIFHQVNAYTVLGGGYTPDLTAKPARTAIYNEAHNGLKNARGSIAMARRPDAIDSATNQFFFNVTDNQDHLDHKDRTSDAYGYCVFGKVVEGLNVIEAIAKSQVKAVSKDGEVFDAMPVQVVEIKSARRIR
ncbi:MAG: peptidylprolyl isomerase [Planctomycetia bacterium]|nr:peptidylprolyl isomerase [Planctomycetia bacterium]